MSDLVIRDVGGKIYVDHTDGITLFYHPNLMTTYGCFEFKYPTPNGSLTKVTDRDLWDYFTPYIHGSDRQSNLLNSLIDGDPLSFLEVGAGLGEMPHYLLSQGHQVAVVDPFNYSVAIELFDKMRKVVEKTNHLERLDLLVKRASTILAGDEVNLFNCTIGEAYGMHPELQKSFNVVIDLYGAVFWMDSDGGDQDEIIAMEKRLLQEGGHHFYVR
jgi:hypothetical protein